MGLMWYFMIGSVVGLYKVTYIKKGIEGNIPSKAECEKKNVITETMLEFGRGVGNGFPPNVKLSLEMGMPHSLIIPFTITTFMWPLFVLLIILMVILNLLIRILRKLIRWIEWLERKLEETAKRQEAKKSEK